MKINDELLVAYADGELDQKQRAMVDDALAQDDALRARLTALTDAADLTRALYEDAINEPVPASLIDTILKHDTAETTTTGVSAPKPEPQRPSWRERLTDWFAAPMPAFGLASFFLLAIVGVVGLGVLDEGVQPGQFVTVGPLSNDSALYAQLETAASGSILEDQGMTIEVIATFVDAGRVCREYSAERSEPASEYYAGIACRGDTSGWEVKFAVEEHIDGDAKDSFYGTASDKLHEAIDGYLAAHIDVDHLEMAAEEALLRSGWVTAANDQ